MTITGALVVYAVTWFMVFFIVLQIRMTAQSDTDHVVPGTPPGAPAQEIVGRKARLTTLIATVLWLVICAIILSGWITIEDLDWFGRMAHRPAP
jgi:predicted secreted protein